MELLLAGCVLITYVTGWLGGFVTAKSLENLRKLKAEEAANKLKVEDLYPTKKS